MWNEVFRRDRETGHQHHWKGGEPLPYKTEKIKTIDLRHSDVRNDHRNLGVAVQPIDCLKR